MHAGGDVRLAAVILAAGTGSRMLGQTKQLLPVSGKPLLQHVIDTVKDSTVDEIVVVIGHDAENVLETVDFASVQVVVNERFSEGQSTSLQRGVGQISADCSGAMIVLGDQPGVTTAVVDQIADAFRKTTPLLLVPLYREQRGNPVVIHRRLFPEVQELIGDTGARSLFSRHLAEIQYVALDIELPPDIDTMEEYRVMALGETPQSR